VKVRAANKRGRRQISVDLPVGWRVNIFWKLDSDGRSAICLVSVCLFK